MGRPLPQDHDHAIALQRAADLTRRHRAEQDPRKRGMDHPYAFRREALDRILSQPGCEGVRFYPAQHEDGSTAIIAVGVDSAGNDILAGDMMQDSFICPPFCSDANALNSDV